MLDSDDKGGSLFAKCKEQIKLGLLNILQFTVNGVQTTTLVK
jgi:hypothetical protein